MEQLITKLNARVHFAPHTRLLAKHAISCKSLDGYEIFVSEHLCSTKLTQVVEHELWHIILGHLDERKYLSNEEKELEVSLNISNSLPNK